MTDVLFRNLSKSFGHHKILEDISLDIKSGEFVVLVGPSGCGDQLPVTVDPGNIHLFDKATGLPL
jgi:ABC-type proline/glycine betaine transport system ATPase subunit